MARKYSSKAYRRYKAYKARKQNVKARVVFNKVDLEKTNEVNLVPEFNEGDFQRSR